jgi:NAD+ kinase
MTWGIVCKPTSSSYSIAKEIFPLLDDVILEEKIATRLGKTGYSLEEIGNLVDRLVVIGGDGTILMVMHYTDRPMFTVNTGSVGFMTEVDAEDAVAGIKKVMKGDYYIEERMRIKTLLNGKRLADAMNEVTVHTADIGKILSLQLAIDGVITEKIDGDGMIVATPTGSTSYALSVGGPIVDPALQAFVTAPMAPFRHIASPLVIPANSELIITVIGKKKAKLVIDGVGKGTISRTDNLRLSCSDKPAAFIRLENNFYSKVFEMLSFAGKRIDYERNSSH